jgi:hypothetical protein
LRDLKEKRHHLDGLLAELEEAGEHAWPHLPAQIDKAITDLSRAVDRARQYLNIGG